MCNNNVKKSVTSDNINSFFLDEKINAYIRKIGTIADEQKCRLVKMVLRHEVHHFPINIPFIAAVKRCKNGKVAVFNIKRAKTAFIDGHSIASETLVDKEFVIDGVRYVETVPYADGYPRYQPLFKRCRRERDTKDYLEEVTFKEMITPHTL